MRIVLMPSVFVPSVGGVQLNTLKLAEELSARGHSVTVLSSNWRQWRLPMFERIGCVRVIRLPFYVYRGSLKSFVAFLLFLPVSAVGTLVMLAFVRPEVINVHFVGANALFASFGAAVFRVPIVVTLHGNEVISLFDPLGAGYTAIEAEAMQRIGERILERAKKVIAVSRYLLVKPTKAVPMIELKSTVVYMPGQVLTGAEYTAEVDEKPYILSVGRFAKEKGFEVLLMAFSEMQDRIPRNVNLVLVGDGPDRRKLAELVAASGCGDRVIFIGWQSATLLAKWYSNCLFLVVPSLSEGLPSVVWEAFAYGKCVIATSVGGIPDVVEDNRTGLIVPPGDSTSLAGAIESLVSDAGRRRYLSQHAKKFGQRVGTWTTSTEAYLRIYKEAIRS